MAIIVINKKLRIKLTKQKNSNQHFRKFFIKKFLAKNIKILAIFYVLFLLSKQVNSWHRS